MLEANEAAAAEHARGAISREELDLVLEANRGLGSQGRPPTRPAAAPTLASVSAASSAEAVRELLRGSSSPPQEKDGEDFPSFGAAAPPAAAFVPGGPNAPVGRNSPYFAPAASSAKEPGQVEKEAAAAEPGTGPAGGPTQGAEAGPAQNPGNERAACGAYREGSSEVGRCLCGHAMARHGPAALLDLSAATALEIEAPAEPRGYK